MELKTYVVESQTNYGTYTHVVNAKTECSAKALAEANGAWKDCEVYEINTQQEGLVFTGD